MFVYLKMKVLELCCGTKSFSNACQAIGFSCITLDYDVSFKPDICMNILEWNYQDYFQPNTFQIIWASPPCTEYSRALTTRPRDLLLADSIVIRIIEIVNYFKPKYVFIENPSTGLLGKRHLLSCFNENKVSYCKYGMPYQKDTSIWSNILIPNVMICTHQDPCLIRSIYKKHRLRAQLFDMKSCNGTILYPLPVSLLYHILHTILSLEIIS